MGGFWAEEWSELTPLAAGLTGGGAGCKGQGGAEPESQQPSSQAPSPEQAGDIGDKKGCTS